MPPSICHAPPAGSTSLLLGVNSLCLMVALFGVILTQYKAQFYVESEVTQGLYFGAAIFFWMVFVFSLTLICFGMMQRKHLQHVSADYPEIDLRTGRKGKFLLGSLVLAALATAAGFGFGGFGMHYMESRKLTTEEWVVADGVDLDNGGNLLMLSILQTIELRPQTWQDIQDRLACCAWTETNGTYATGYCCDNDDHSCRENGPVPCREPWLAEMSTFNTQVCVLLLAVGALQFLTACALLQLRCFSRSSLYLYSAYGGSISEKRKREKAAAAASKKAAAEAAAKVRALGEGAYDDEYGGEENDGDEAEKQPLTGTKGPSASADPDGTPQGTGTDSELGSDPKAAEPILQNA